MARRVFANEAEREAARVEYNRQRRVTRIRAQSARPGKPSPPTKTAPAMSDSAQTGEPSIYGAIPAGTTALRAIGKARAVLEDMRMEAELYGKDAW